MLPTSDQAKDSKSITGQGVDVSSDSHRLRGKGAMSVLTEQHWNGFPSELMIMNCRAKVESNVKRGVLDR